MEKTAFDLAIEYTLKNEGGFSNNKNDKGGATRFGITRETASEWRRQEVTVDDMMKFTVDEAKDIYRQWYWRPLGCEKISSLAIATSLFDIGVVRGHSFPAMWAQEICNANGAKLKVDSVIGPASIEALNSIDEKIFVTAFSERAANSFRSIVNKNPTQLTFLRGWLNRAERLLTLIGKNRPLDQLA